MHSVEELVAAHTELRDGYAAFCGDLVNGLSDDGLKEMASDFAGQILVLAAKRKAGFDMSKSDAFAEFGLRAATVIISTEMLRRLKDNDALDTEP